MWNSQSFWVSCHLLLRSQAEFLIVFPGCCRTNRGTHRIFPWKLWKIIAKSPKLQQTWSFFLWVPSDSGLCRSVHGRRLHEYSRISSIFGYYMMWSSEWAIENTFSLGLRTRSWYLCITLVYIYIHTYIYMYVYIYTYYVCIYIYIYYTWITTFWSRQFLALPMGRLT